MSREHIARVVTIVSLVALLGGVAPPAARAQTPVEQAAVDISLDGVQLMRTAAGPVEVFNDPDIDGAAIENVRAAILLGLAEVPSLAGLPAFTTPIRAFVLEDEARFRLALAEIANVRVDLVSVDIAGYTIERDGVMLIFFVAANVAEPASALLGFGHELAHLAVREASRRRAVPQWFNEGYASWISSQQVAQHYPAEAQLQQRIDHLAVASALYTRGLIPWPDLVTRARFSRAGVDGLVSLAYGQSTLFIDYLAARHGKAALARFLTNIGEGAGATASFTTAIGSFGPEAAMFEASLAQLKSDLPPGLYLIQRASEQQPAVFGVSGGATMELAVVELLRDERVVRRREMDLDGAGMLIFSLPLSLLDGSEALSVRVTAPLIGALMLNPRTQDRALTTVTPIRRPTPSPSPAPVQIPAA